MGYLLNWLFIVAATVWATFNILVVVAIVKAGLIRKWMCEVVMHTMIAVICLAMAFLNVTLVSYGVAQNKALETDSRPLYIVTSAIKYGTGDVVELSVQPKEASKYVVHELTEEDIAEIEYCDSLELLAICVEAEAGNQDMLGKRLVADVILNRVDSDDFPDDITSVITEVHNGVPQFSSYMDGHMDAVWEPSAETYEAVKMELEQRTNTRVLYFTEGRYNPYCEPGFIHGSHYFGY